MWAIFENDPEGIVVCDQQGPITMTNPTADALYKRHLEVLVAEDSRMNQLFTEELLSDELPVPDVLAEEVTENLEAGSESFKQVSSL
ncbi:MAG: hypothetical protein ACQERT_05270 [Thermodesulfobacteriota bacterium]